MVESMVWIFRAILNSFSNPYERTYGLSMNENICELKMFVVELGTRFGDRGRISHRYLSWSPFTNLIDPYSQTAEEGAQTLLHLCLDPAGGEKSGEFWMECRPAYIFRRVDPTRNERLLELTRKTLGLQG